jgi:hypothetical protein
MLLTSKRRRAVLVASALLVAGAVLTAAASRSDNRAIGIGLLIGGFVYVLTIVMDRPRPIWAPSKPATRSRRLLRAYANCLAFGVLPVLLFLVVETIANR